jgi:hypothetical protein
MTKYEQKERSWRGESLVPAACVVEIRLSKGIKKLKRAEKRIITK